MSRGNAVDNDRLLSTRPIPADMKVRWHGHSCFEFGDSQLTLVVDPHDGRSIGIRPPAVSADIVLMTHNHYDHNAVRAVRGRHDDILSREGIFTVKGLEVEGLHSWHDAVGGTERGPNTMYLFTMDDISVCHCGDLGSIPDEDVLTRIRNVDMLFVPVGETFTMPLPEVKRFLEIVNPNVIVPMHYRVGGLSIPISPLDDFLDMIPENAVDYIGNEIDVSRDDIDGMKQCWVFDR